MIVSVLSEENCSFLSQRQVLAGNKNLVGKQRVSVYEFSFFFFFFDALEGREHVFVGQYLGGGDGNPFQYPCLENPMDSGTWWATVHGVVKSWM